jgi:hypothetical protein
VVLPISLMGLVIVMPMTNELRGAANKEQIESGVSGILLGCPNKFPSSFIIETHTTQEFLFFFFWLC